MRADDAWCGLCLAPVGSHAPGREALAYSDRVVPEGASRSGPGVHERIDWNRVRQTTRIQPTVTTFGWRGKLLISAPPYLFLIYFTFMLFGNPMFAFALGPPLLAHCIWWTRQVWRPGYADRT